VTPEPTPVPTPEPTPDPTPTPVPEPVAAFSCSASGLTLTCDGSASTHATGYSWTFGDGGTANEAEPAHTYAAAGTYTVQLTVTNASGSDVHSQEYTLG
jgi:PKD repeat protein